ncbi:hypothetical protein Tco_1563680 [Tanacetum coccineum]
MHSNGMACFKGLESHLKTLYPISDFSVTLKRDFETAFIAFFGEEHQTFQMKMFHNLDQLQLQFERENLHAVNAKTCLEVLRTQFKEFFCLKKINPVQVVDANLVVTKSSGIESENNSSENSLNKSVNETQMQMLEGKVDMGKALDVWLVITESIRTKSDKQDISSRSENYTTHVVDADIRPVNDQEPLADTIENADLKAQIQEKVFANAALKNKLRKLKGTSVDTKFAKLTILGKSVLQSIRNQSVVRQSNAFKSERPNFSKPRFASQVDVNNAFSKPVTPHYLPKVQEYMLAKPHHLIAPGSSRNSQE